MTVNVDQHADACMLEQLMGDDEVLDSFITDLVDRDDGNELEDSNNGVMWGGSESEHIENID